MAIPYEKMTVADRLQDRAARSRRREAWQRDTEAQEIIYNMAVTVTAVREEMEDSAVRLVALQDGPIRNESLGIARRMTTEMFGHDIKL